jgi:hypothetical protein
MEDTAQIHASSYEPNRKHKLFRGIMLSFLFTIIIIGVASVFGQGIPEDRSKKVEDIKQVLEIDEDVVLPTDGIQYQFKLFRETLSEIFTFDKSDKEKLNVRIIDERAKEIAILEAKGENIPDNVVRNYSDRLTRAERFISLTSDDNENIDTRTVVRTALEEHKTRFIDKIQRLEEQPSNTVLTRVASDFGDRINDIVNRIDRDEVSIVKNTIPIVKQKQQNIKLAEIAGDVATIKKEIKELEEIDDKLNRLHLAKLCVRPIKTLSITSFDDVKRDCPFAILMEDEIREELRK